MRNLETRSDLVDCKKAIQDFHDNLALALREKGAEVSLSKGCLKNVNGEDVQFRLSVVGIHRSTSRFSSNWGEWTGQLQITFRTPTYNHVWRKAKYEEIANVLIEYAKGQKKSREAADLREKNEKALQNNPAYKALLKRARVLGIYSDLSGNRIKIDLPNLTLDQFQLLMDALEPSLEKIEV